MPTYEYECDYCNYRFDQRQSFEEEPVANCPQCTRRAHRVIQCVPILFKGSGFYCTDNSRTTRNVPGPKCNDEGVKSGAKTEIKPKAKIEDKVEAKIEESD